jgi:hypothetical protein
MAQGRDYFWCKWREEKQFFCALRGLNSFFIRLTAPEKNIFQLWKLNEFALAVRGVAC